MPLIIVHTNIKDADIASDFEEKVSNKVAEVLNKPIERIQVIVEAGKRMCKNLDNSPLCLIEIHSINVFDPAKNPGYTKEFLPFFTSILGVANDRCTLLYYPINTDYFGIAK